MTDTKPTHTYVDIPMTDDFRNHSQLIVNKALYVVIREAGSHDRHGILDPTP